MNMAVEYEKSRAIRELHMLVEAIESLRRIERKHTEIAI